MDLQSDEGSCNWGWVFHVRDPTSIDANSNTFSLKHSHFYSCAVPLHWYKDQRHFLLHMWNSVTSAFGLNGSHIILKYLRTNVFPHEDHFAGHHYNFTRSFNEYSNTCLEGTNNGLKYNSESVLPSMGLAKAGKCMINQDERKASDRKRSSASAFNGIPLYTNTAICCQIQSVAETMICEQQTLLDQYASVCMHLLDPMVCCLLCWEKELLPLWFLAKANIFRCPYCYPG